MKQCYENCGDTCDNARICISNLLPDVTTDGLQQLFGGIGQVLLSVFIYCSYEFAGYILLRMRMYGTKN